MTNIEGKGITLNQPDADDEKSFDDYWQVIKKRKNILIYFLVLVFVLTLVYVLVKTPVYQAYGTLMIERDDKRVMLLQDSFSLSNSQLDTDFITQVKILNSRTLAHNVIKQLDLQNKNKFSTPEKKQESRSKTLTRLIDLFQQGMSISQVHNSRLISVSYRSISPELAANIVNTLIEEYIKFNIKLKTSSTRAASEFLVNQIADLKTSLAKKEKALQEYSKRKQLYYTEGKNSSVVEKFSDLNKAFTAAQIKRIDKEAVYRELKDKRFENYPEVRKNILIQNLKKDYSSLESKYKNKTQIFKESYPEMKQLRSELTSLQQRLNSEIRDLGRKALQEAEDEYNTALKREKSLANLVNTQKGFVANTNASGIYYRSLQIEVENLNQLLDHLVKKEQGALFTSRLEGMKTSNIKIIDHAEIPLVPVAPKKKQVLLRSVILGIFGGLLLIFAVEWLDQTVSSTEDIEKIFQTPSLGLIPEIGFKAHFSYDSIYTENENKSGTKLITNIELVNHFDPESMYAEVYRNIRTSILMSTPDRSPRVISFTSSLQGEGKTATIINMATSFAEMDKKVLLIDCDMRRPRLHKIFKLKNTRGLSSCLVGRDNLSEIIHQSEVKNLFLLSSGPIPPNPSELLNGKIMANLVNTLLKSFDYILLDSPPLVGIIDPLIISKYCEGTVVVTWAGKTNKKVILASINELKKYRVKTLGIILNRVKVGKKSTRYSYYNDYKYKYRQTLPQKKNKPEKLA